MTVHDLLAELAAFRAGATPKAGPELHALFASVAVAAEPAAVTRPGRSLPVYKRIVGGLPSKIAAGALGALLAGTVSAGALTGTMQLTSENDPVAVCALVAADDAAAENDDCVEVADESEGDDAVETGDESSAEDADHADADGSDEEAVVPTSQSEAAHTHAFDEVCGNHGAYVRHFAHTGQEPECATADRADAVEVTEVSAGLDDQANANAKAEAKHERKAAKATAGAKSNKSGKGGR